MRVILEGCDGSGKSTFAETLATEYGCDILHMTRYSDKSLKSYLIKMSVNDNIIFDRCFISEYVYSKVFNRYSQINDDNIRVLLDYAKALKYKIYILTCDNDEIMKRLSERNNETNEILNNVIKINDAYVDFAKKFNVKLLKKEDIDEYI